MPATMSYRLRRCNNDAFIGLIIRYPLQKVCFSHTGSLVSSFNADSMEYLVPSLDDDKPHKSFHDMSVDWTRRAMDFIPLIPRGGRRHRPTSVWLNNEQRSDETRTFDISCYVLSWRNFVECVQLTSFRGVVHILYLQISHLLRFCLPITCSLPSTIFIVRCFHVLPPIISQWWENTVTYSEALYMCFVCTPFKETTSTPVTSDKTW